jgi:hypothetical protein
LNHPPHRDRRTRPRFDVVGELWGRLEAPTSLAVQNIGRGGALLESPVALLVGSVHRVVLGFPGEQTDTVIRVRHTTAVTGVAAARPYLIGVEFLELSQGIATIVDRWIEGAGDV